MLFGVAPSAKNSVFTARLCHLPSLLIDWLIDWFFYLFCAIYFDPGVMWINLIQPVFNVELAWFIWFDPFSMFLATLMSFVQRTASDLPLPWSMGALQFNGPRGFEPRSGWFEPRPSKVSLATAEWWMNHDKPWMGIQYHSVFWYTPILCHKLG